MSRFGLVWLAISFLMRLRAVARFLDSIGEIAVLGGLVVKGLLASEAMDFL